MVCSRFPCYWDTYPPRCRTPYRIKLMRSLKSWGWKVLLGARLMWCRMASDISLISGWLWLLWKTNHHTISQTRNWATDFGTSVVLSVLKDLSPKKNTAVTVLNCWLLRDRWCKSGLRSICGWYVLLLFKNVKNVIPTLFIIFLTQPSS